MKKLLIASLALFMVSSAAIAAETQTTTCTEQFIQKHTQKLVDTEKKLQEQQKANEDAWAKKKEAYQKDVKARQDARLKQREEFQKKLEADRKAREEASKARQQKFEQKKKLFNELISE